MCIDSPSLNSLIYYTVRSESEGPDELAASLHTMLLLLNKCAKEFCDDIKEAEAHRHTVVPVGVNISLDIGRFVCLVLWMQGVFLTK